MTETAKAAPGFRMPVWGWILIAGLVGLAFGAHVHWRPRDLAVVFHNWPWGPGGALGKRVRVAYNGQGAWNTIVQRVGSGTRPSGPSSGKVGVIGK